LLIAFISAKDNLPYFLNQLAQENTQTSDVSFNQIIPFVEQNIRPGAIIFLISDFHDINLDDFHFLGELSHKSLINIIHLYDKMEKICFVNNKMSFQGDSNGFF
jgi:hypothetical protein